MNIFKLSSDKIGALTSFLCLIHCFATPLIFIMGSCGGHCHDNVPDWWMGFDLIFLFVSFISIWFSVKQTTSKVIKPLFWLGWLLMGFAVVNEKLHLTELPHWVIYIPAGFLIGAHIYNLKYCQCQPEEESCCVDKADPR